jgi:hypothetical protein
VFGSGGRHSVDLLEAEQVLASIGSGVEDAALGVFARRPVVTLALDGRPAETELAARAARLPCVFVGVATSESDVVTAEFDVMLTTAASAPRPWVSCPEGTAPVLADVLAMVEASPVAATTLVQTLRLGASLPLPDALLIESLAYGVLQAGQEHARWLSARRVGSRPRSGETPVLVEREGTVVTITLNRPRLRNCLDVSMRDALVDALSIVIVDSSVTQVHLRGAGPAFCVGGDLREFGTTPDPATAHLVRASRSAAASLAACAPRVTAFLHGHCIGAGIELPAFAAHVIAAPDTVIRLPELALGLIPGAGGTVSITRRIGRARTAYLALSGADLEPERAWQWGLVDEIRPSD